jgi:hypothetical protein
LKKKLLSRRGGGYIIIVVVVVVIAKTGREKKGREKKKRDPKSKQSSKIRHPVPSLPFASSFPSIPFHSLSHRRSSTRDVVLQALRQRHDGVAQRRAAIHLGRSRRTMMAVLVVVVGAVAAVVRSATVVGG